MILSRGHHIQAGFLQLGHLLPHRVPEPRGAPGPLPRGGNQTPVRVTGSAPAKPGPMPGPSTPAQTLLTCLLPGPLQPPSSLLWQNLAPGTQPAPSAPLPGQGRLPSPPSEVQSCGYYPRAQNTHSQLHQSEFMPAFRAHTKYCLLHEALPACSPRSIVSPESDLRELRLAGDSPAPLQRGLPGDPSLGLLSESLFRVPQVAELPRPTRPDAGGGQTAHGGPSAHSEMWEAAGWAHLAEEDPGVCAVALSLLPTLQHHDRAGLHRRVLSQTLTQAPPVQGKECQRHLQGFVPQPK